MFRAVRNLTRMVGIVRCLGRHGALFSREVGETNPALGSVLGLLDNRKAPGRPGERLARALTELGPSFIKLGQMLSTRADLVGEQTARDLSELQDKLPPFPAEAARRTIETELGARLDDLFAAFDDKPVAAASIAQVHRAVARTRDGEPGQEVAVKVLRPDIERAVTRDLNLFHFLADLLHRMVPKARRLKPREVVAIFDASIRLEMDLRMEAAAASELADNFAGDPNFNVPAIDWDRSGRRVLTLEWVDGIAVDEVDRIREAGFDPDDILAQASAAFFNQVFRDGFFHADLHPGNLFVNREGRIVAVDLGIMGRLDRATRTYLADMLLGFLNGDYRRVALVHFRAGYVPPHQSLEAFTQACRSIGEPLQRKPLNEISVGRLLAQLFQVTERFEMQTQPQLLLLQKSMLTAEGVGRILNPNINMWELARPLIEDWMRENRGPEARMVDALEDVAIAVSRLPSMVRELDRAAALIRDGGMPLHPDTIDTLIEKYARRRCSDLWPLWTLVVVLTIALVWALSIGG